MNKVKLIKGKQSVVVYDCEVGAYKKNGWTREGEKPKKSTKKEVN